MGKKSAPPPPPDYTAAAERTAQSSQEAQTRADWANRATQITPFGTSSWTSAAGTDPSTGQAITNWTQNISLDPASQQALDQQQALQAGRSDIAGGMMSRLGQDFANPYDWSKMTGFGAAPQAGNLGGNVGLDSRMRLEQGMLDRMRPEHQFQQESLEGKLSNMGLARGSEAWNREMQRMGDQQSRERFNAMQAGLGEQQGQFQMAQAADQQRFGQGMQGAEYQTKLRQMQIAEEAQRRGMTLNEMNALLSGQQVSMPSMPGFAQSQSAGGVNYSGAAQNQYNAAMDQYNAKQAQAQGMMSGLGSLASMGMMAFSDERLKDNIEYVGEHPSGVGVYEYDIEAGGAPRREIGMMAQEVAQVMPERVARHPSGYLMVNYKGL